MATAYTPPSPYGAPSDVEKLASNVGMAPPSNSNLPKFMSPLTNMIDSFNTARLRLALPDPGKSEDLGREVKTTHLTNYMFDGARADLAKNLSLAPAFQVTHSFTAGAQGGPMEGVSPGTYQFNAVYATPKAFMQGAIDGEGSLNGRFNWGWTSKDITKFSVQLPRSAAAQPMFAVEHDKTGLDYTLQLKAYNPSPSNLTGNYLASYLQSITPHFALGVDAVYQKPTPELADCAVGYSAKWHNVRTDPATNQPAKDSWIATGQIMPQGLWNLTYWRKLAERVDAGVDLMVSPAVQPRDRKAIATAGVKYDMRMATFRGQIDSQGKVSALLEQRLSPSFSFLVSGELDHVKSQSKFGVGLMVESTDESLMTQAEGAPMGPPPI